MNLSRKALLFAIRAHASINHRREYTNDPYVVHPIAVAQIVRDAGGTDEMIAAAYLHDVVEDTPVAIEDVVAEFGSEIAILVSEVTDISQPSDGDRATRKMLDRFHLADASPEGQTIKLADIIDNSMSIAHHDPKFAKVYMPEKRALLGVLTRGNADLRSWAMEIVARWESQNA